MQPTWNCNICHSDDLWYLCKILDVRVQEGEAELHTKWQSEEEHSYNTKENSQYTVMPAVGVAMLHISAYYLLSPTPFLFLVHYTNQ